MVESSTRCRDLRSERVFVSAPVWLRERVRSSQRKEVSLRSDFMSQPLGVLPISDRLFYNNSILTSTLFTSLPSSFSF